MNVQVNLAKIVSIVFYPSGVLFTALISSVYPALGLSLLCFSFGLLIPIILSVFYFYYVQMPETWVVPREYRYFPLLFSILSNLILLFFLPSNASLAKYFTILSVCVTTFCLLVTFYWKISLHLAGMGAIAGFFLLIHIPMEWQLFWLLATILTAWARMYLKSHDIWQVLAGFFSAFFFAYLCHELRPFLFDSL